MVKPISRKSANKNPPFFSQEFIIQNHADIVSCVAMLLVIGLMFQATSSLSTLFITIQHNVTNPENLEQNFYMPGPYDSCTVFFYMLIGIVIHAIIQEYVLDKISKRLHLSKSKLQIFSVSGQLVAYYLFSSFLGLELLLNEGYLTNPSLLWKNYPAPLSLKLKFLILVQLAYSLHEIPELYFQRIPRAQWLVKTAESLVAVSFVTLLYSLNFNRLLLFLLEFYYISELGHHGSQIVHAIDKEERLNKVTTLASNAVLVMARLGSVVLSVLTLWFGLALDQSAPSDAPGNYNHPLIRMAVLSVIVILQIYLMFNFVTQHLARARENNETLSKTNLLQAKPKVKKEKKKVKKSIDSDLPEVDQNTNKNLRKNLQKVK